ncbi:hypothetical protein, partial [Alistipes putredinis]|uniref:hypothetical protein n=1 Tax=Alistipes putredinis TaxID=28117 RepID=UPI003AB4197C
VGIFAFPYAYDLMEMLTFADNKNSGECNLKIYFCSFSLLAATIHRCASTIYSQKSDWLSGKMA